MVEVAWRDAGWPHRAPTAVEGHRIHDAHCRYMEVTFGTHLAANQRSEIALRGVLWFASVMHIRPCRLFIRPPGFKDLEHWLLNAGICLKILCSPGDLDWYEDVRPDTEEEDRDLALQVLQKDDISVRSALNELAKEGLSTEYMVVVQWLTEAQHNPKLTPNPSSVAANLRRHPATTERLTDGYVQQVIDNFRKRLHGLGKTTS